MAALQARFLYSLLLLAAASPLRAEIYKWVDAEGAIHYSDTPPATQQNTLEITGSISSYDSPEIVQTEPAANAAAATSGMGKTAKSKRVVMYSAAWCGVCKTAKKYFNENNISYTEYDIETNSEAKRNFERMKARGVPVILVGDRRMNGFSADGFEQLYHGQ